MLNDKTAIKKHKTATDTQAGYKEMQKNHKDMKQNNKDTHKMTIKQPQIVATQQQQQRHT